MNAFLRMPIALFLMSLSSATLAPTVLSSAPAVLSSAPTILSFAPSVVFDQGPLTVHSPAMQAAAPSTSDSIRARELFEEVEKRQDLARTEVAVQTMTIHDARGRTRSRTMGTWVRRDPQADTRDQLIVFTEPGSVRGSAFLTRSIGDDDTQKLYLPAVGRIQTIQRDQRGDSFMGSDFTYEDLSAQQASDFRFERLQETDSEWTVYAVKASPTPDDRYTRLEFTIDRQTYAITRILYLREDGTRVRELVSEEFRNSIADLWSPMRMTMKDLEKGTQTVLEWSSRTMGEEIPDWRFTDRGLQRGL